MQIINYDHSQMAALGKQYKSLLEIADMHQTCKLKCRHILLDDVHL